MQNIISKIEDSLKSKTYKDLISEDLPLLMDEPNGTLIKKYYAIKLGDGVTINGIKPSEFTLSIGDESGFTFTSKNNINDFMANIVNRQENGVTRIENLELGEATQVMSLINISNCQKMQIELLHAYFNADSKDKNFICSQVIEACNNIGTNSRIYSKPYSDFDKTNFKIDEKLTYADATNKMDRYANRGIIKANGYTSKKACEDTIRYKEYLESKISSDEDKQKFQDHFKYNAPKEGMGM